MASSPRTIVSGPAFTNFDGRMREVQYRCNEVLKKWLNEWAGILGSLEMKIDFRWEKAPQLMGHRLLVYVDNWVTQMFVDDALFDHINKDFNYIEYIGENILRCSQTGIIMHWLERLYEQTEDTHDLGKMWREDLSKIVKEAHFRRLPSLGARADLYDLVDLVVIDNPIPITVTIKEVMDEPKLLLARLTMMKR